MGCCPLTKEFLLLQSEPSGKGPLIPVCQDQELKGFHGHNLRLKA